MKIRNVKKLKLRFASGRTIKTTYRKAYALALRKPESFTIITKET